MTWAKTGPAVIAIACVLVIIAHSPAVLVDPVVTALAQIRSGTNVVVTPNASLPATENPYPEETSGQKRK